MDVKVTSLRIADRDQCVESMARKAKQRLTVESKIKVRPSRETRVGSLLATHELPRPRNSRLFPIQNS